MKNSETYIITAKTVDEAMAIAQREYGGAGKDISFDILEMPKKGFLGFGAKDAKIKVTVAEEEDISLSSIVDEMKSYRMQTDRLSTYADGRNAREDKPAGDKQPKKQNPQQGQKPQQNKPADKPTEPKAENKPAPVKKDEPKQQNRQNTEKTAAKVPQTAPTVSDEQKQPKTQQNQQPKPEKQEKPVPPKAPKADKPAPGPEQKPLQEKPAEKAADKPAPEKPAEKPVQNKTPASPKPEKKEARADGILDSMPAYTISDDRDKTPVYKETGANVKTYTKSTMHTAAVADGSISADTTPVADVRWDSARDLKKAEVATAAAIAAAAPKTVSPISAEEAARTEAKPDSSSSAAKSKRAAVQERYAAIRSQNAAKAASELSVEHPEEPENLSAETEGEYIPSDGSVDVAALEAAIEAMVEELPAPEARKKTGITQAEMDHALAFVSTLLGNMQIEAKAQAVVCPEGEEIEIEGDANVYPAIEIVGDGTGILIGHHGETLDAIQYLLNLAAIRHSDNPAGDYVKISLDIENYRAKREETLRSLARRMAARALKYKRNVFLEPMNAYERRIIHSELQHVEGVSTHSVGTDKNRKIVITYEGADRAADDRRRSADGRHGSKRDNNRSRGGRHSESREAPAETPDAPEATADMTEAPQPENKPKNNRNRNRNRNRRRPQLDTDGPAEIQSAAGDGASAIIPPEEREAIDKQLSDPANKPLQQKKPAEVDVPAFLQRPADEPAEHLREN